MRRNSECKVYVQRRDTNRMSNSGLIGSIRQIEAVTLVNAGTVDAGPAGRRADRATADNKDGYRDAALSRRWPAYLVVI